MADHRIKIVVEGDDKASGALRKASGALDDFGSKAKGFGGALTAGLTLPLVGLGAVAIKMSTDLNAAMANVASLGVPTERVNELKVAVQDMSIAVGKSTADLSDGLYQVISAFGDTADTVQILEINAKAAAAGLATTTDAINLTSAVTKGYGDTSADAIQKASDLAFVTVQLGQTTFPELAASIGKVVPLTNALGVSQEELFATMATLTGVTGNAAEVSTQLRGVLQSLMAPTGDMTGLMEKLGYANGQAMIDSLGLKGTIDAITKAAEATGTPLAKYIGSIEGQTLALTLAGSQSDNYITKLAAMGEAAGATDAAFAAQTQGINAAGFAMAQARAKMEVFAQKMGDALGPALLAALDAVQPLLDELLTLAGRFTALSPTTQRWILALGAVAVAAGPVIFAVGAIGGAIGAALPVIGAIGAALGLLLSPIGLVAAAAAGLGAVFYSLNIGGFGDMVDGVIAKVNELAAAVPGAVAAFSQFGGGALKEVIAQLTGFGIETHDTTDNIRELAFALTGSWAVADQWSNAITNAGTAIQGFAASIAAIATTIGETLGGRIAVASESFSGLGEKLAEIGVALSGFVAALAPIGQAIAPVLGAVGIAGFNVAIGALDIALNAIIQTFGLVGTALTAFATEVTAVITGISQIISGFTLIFTGAFSGNWSTILEGAGTVFAGFGTIISGTLESMAILISGAVAAIGTLASSIATDLGFTRLSTDIQAVTDKVSALFTWLGKLFSGDESLNLTAPEWVTTLLDWDWPGLPDTPADWLTTLLGWAWPKLAVTAPGWVTKLVGWSWPKFDQPEWLKELFKWKWPGLPQLPPWLGGGGTTTSEKSTGTRHWRGGPTWVGEKGAELVNLPRGSQIFNHERSMAMAGSDAGGDTYNVTFAPVVNSDIDLEVAFDRLLKKLGRRRP